MSLVPDWVHGFDSSMRMEDLCWLAGLLEGEGSFLRGAPSEPNQPAISIQMCDQDVMQRVGDLVSRKPIYVRPKKEHHKPTWSIRIKGTRGVALMEQLRPLMGARRRHQIDLALATYEYRGGFTTGTRVAALEMRFAGIPATEVALAVGASRRWVDNLVANNPNWKRGDEIVISWGNPSTRDAA